MRTPCIDAAVIDRINILQATHRAMNEALAQLVPPPAHALVDGRPVKTLRFSQTALVKGDARSYSIAAASVLAKVSRDRRMLELDARYPGYGLARHKGYGTAAHRAAAASLPPCSALLPGGRFCSSSPSLCCSWARLCMCVFMRHQVWS